MDPGRKTSDRATEPKCKFRLANSLKSAHKKFGAERSSIFRVPVIVYHVIHTHTDVYTYGIARHYIPRLLAYCRRGITTSITYNLNSTLLVRSYCKLPQMIKNMHSGV